MRSAKRLAANLLMMSDMSTSLAFHPDLVADPGRIAALAGFRILDTPAEEGFDDIVQLAVLLCDVPVALVSLVAEDRQWFKARIGLTACETDLDSSVCAHALAEPDLFVIPDLTADVRTSFNPLVMGEPHLRFYAGAPLRLSTGHVLGSLCVIDHRPRPEGLTGKQADGLRALARQVVSQLELRQVLRERESMMREQQRSHSILQTVTDHVGQAVFQMDGNGVITFANPAAVGMFGYSPEELLGQSLHGLLHHSHPDGSPFPAEECELRQALIHGELLEETSQVFFRKDGTPCNVLVTNAPVISDGVVESAVLTVSDVTVRLRAEQALTLSNQRKAALARLGDHLRATMSVDAMSYTAASIIGRTLGASQAAYGVVDAGQGTVLIGPSWHAPGFASLTGTFRFKDYGMLLQDLGAGRTVVIPNVAEDDRTCHEVAAFRALGVFGFIHVPLVEQGELVALCLANFAEPRPVSREEEEFIRAAADRTCAGIARIRAEEHQDVLNNELSHRLKNTMAMIQAIANQTLKSVPERGPVKAFEQRLLALSTAHDVLLQKDWAAADLDDVLRRVLEAAGVGERYDADGSSVRLGSRAALSTSLLLHELATNASKYGALTVADGRIEIRWWFEGEDAGEELVLIWRETGGPPAVAPQRQGFGSRLLRMGLVGTGGSQVDYGDTGLAATFRAPRKQVEQA